MQIKLKHLLIVFIILSILLTLSCVSAQDVNATGDNEIFGEVNHDDAVLSQDDSINAEVSSKNQTDNNADSTVADKKASFKTTNYTTYVQGKIFRVKLLDENGTILTKKTVHFKIDGVKSDAKTTKYGNARLLLNVSKGIHTIKYSFDEKGYKPIKSSSKILVITNKNSKIEASTYTAYVGLKNDYIVVLTVDGIPLANRPVDFTINGKTYHKTTNSKGEADLPIGLKKGNYPIDVFYAGEKNIKKAGVKSKIIVKQGMPKVLVKANSVVYKSYIISPFKVKLLDERGNVLKNKTVTFTVNNKKYVKKTDKNGIATLNIGLKKGTYKIKVYSGKTSIYKNVSKTFSITIKPSETRNNGIWLFGADMKKADLNKLQKHGIKHIFLNFKAVSLWGKSSVEKFVKKANNHKIKVHIWMQVFYMNKKWSNPAKNGKIDYDLINSRIAVAKKYAKIKGIAGVQFDYLRYPSNAYKYDKSVDAVNYFTKKASNEIHKINPKLIVSAAIMPEPQVMKKYYGQDIPTMSKYLDVIIPMEYKGNYKKSSSWIQKVTKTFVSQSKGAEIWVGLQSYKSDSNVVKLSSKALMKDSIAASRGGAHGVVFFRYGLTNLFNLNDI